MEGYIGLNNIAMPEMVKKQSVPVKVRTKFVVGDWSVYRPTDIISRYLIFWRSADMWTRTLQR